MAPFTLLLRRFTTGCWGKTTFQLERENICLIRENGTPRIPAKFFGLRTCAGDKRNCWHLRNEFDRNTKQRKRVERVTVVEDRLFREGGGGLVGILGSESSAHWSAECTKMEGFGGEDQKHRNGKSKKESETEYQ